MTQASTGATSSDLREADADRVEAVASQDQWAPTPRRLSTNRVLWFALSFIPVLIASTIVGPDANWDLLNYHYNNGRALVTGSFLSDVSAAGFQSWLHPLIDAPVYLAVEVADNKWGLIVWMAVAQWLCYVAVWRLAGCFEGLRESYVRRTLAVVVVATGAGAWSVAFTAFGDWIVTALLCEATRALLMSFDDHRDPIVPTGRGDADRLQLQAGVLLGLAASAKLVAGPFVLSFVVGVAITLSLAAMGRVLLGALASATVVSGPWMLYLAIRYGNPLFPWYNGIFRNDSVPAGNFDDRRYGSENLRDVVSFPVRVWQGGTTYTEIPLRDWRYVSGLLVLAVFVVLLVHARVTRHHAQPSPDRRSAIFLATLLGIGYLGWIVAFGIYRYFLFGEVMVSMLLAAATARLVVNEWRFAAIVLVVLPVGIAYEIFPAWGRGDVFSNSQLDQIIENQPESPSHVVIAAGAPISYLTEAFPAPTRFAAIDSYYNGYLLLGGQLEDDLRDFVSAGLDDEGLFVVADQGTTALPHPFEDLRLTSCANFQSLGRALELCHAVRS